MKRQPVTNGQAVPGVRREGGVPSILLSTRGAHPRDKIGAWEEMVAQSGFVLTNEGIVGSLDTFDSELVARPVGPATIVEVSCNNRVVARRPSDIAKCSTGTVFVFEQVGRGGSTFETRGGRCSFDLRAGEMIVGDTDEPFVAATEAGFDHRLWVIPRNFLADAPGVLGTIAGGTRLAGDGRTKLLTTFLHEFRQQLDQLPADAAEAYAANIAQLLRIAIDPADDFDGKVQSINSARLARVRRAIEHRLFDPLLSPARIADDCGTSVRTLHNLFLPTGTTFSDYVTGRRLEIAHAMLTRPDTAFRPIADIAYETGFNSLSTFYTRYKERFGHAPGDARGSAVASDEER